VEASRCRWSIAPAEIHRLLAKEDHELVRKRRGAFTITVLHEDVGSHCQRRIQALRDLDDSRKLERTLNIGKCTGPVLTRGPDASTRRIAVGSGIVGLAGGLDLVEETVNETR
jgi:hypothetical protein